MQGCFSNSKSNEKNNMLITTDAENIFIKILISIYTEIS